MRVNCTDGDMLAVLTGIKVGMVYGCSTAVAQEAAMRANETPHYDASVNTTGCCPKFNAGGWDDQELHFANKPFGRATTHSIMHVPVNMGSVFARVREHIDDAGASAEGQYIVLSRDLSPWTSEHLFSVSKAVPEEEMITLNGDFVTKVFEGAFEQTGEWHDEMLDLARQRTADTSDVYFFYTTCPKCAAAYGKNYVVGVTKII